MKAEVTAAIAELKAALPNAMVTACKDEDGGAYVEVDPVDIGSTFSPSTTWVAFHITYPYPEADLYPHFIAAEVTYIGEGETPNQHGEGDLPKAMSRGHKSPSFEKAAIQVSRRTKTPVTAVRKLEKVLEFLRSR
jgi:hypothetical protein